MLGVANVRGNLLPIVDLKQFLEGERTVLHESQRMLLVRQPGGDVAVLIDELLRPAQLQRAAADPRRPVGRGAVAEGRYAHFIDRAYRLDDAAVGHLQPRAAGPHARIPPSRRLTPHRPIVLFLLPQARTTPEVVEP